MHWHTLSERTRMLGCHFLHVIVQFPLFCGYYSDHYFHKICWLLYIIKSGCCQDYCSRWMIKYGHVDWVMGMWCWARRFFQWRRNCMQSQRSLKVNIQNLHACYKLCVTCTWWLLGLAMKEPWLGLGRPPPVLTVCMDRLRIYYFHLVDGWFLARKTAWALSWSMATDSADYCMLVNEWTLRFCCRSMDI